MATVPNSFVPQVGQGGGGVSAEFVAPGIATMENVAAEQQVKLGGVTERLGTAMWRIGQIMEDDINTARAKGADAAYLDAVNDILNGDNGYMFSKGADAQGRFDAASGELANRAQSIMDGLDNDVQRRMFQSSAQRNLSNARTRMNIHRNDEVVKWNAAESAARASRYGGEAVNEYQTRNDDGVDSQGRPTGKYAVNVENAMREARNRGRIAGLPDDSEAMRDMERGVMDGIAGGVVGRLMLDSDFSGGLRYIEGIREKLSPETYERLRSALTVNREAQSIPELGESIKNGRGLVSPSATEPFVNPVATPSRTTTSALGPEKGVVIEAEEGSKVVAPYDGIITGIKNEEDGSITLAIRLDNGDLAVMSGLSKDSEKIAPLVEEGRVSRGVPIGVMGTGPLTYSIERDGKPLPLEQVNSVNTDQLPRKVENLQEALNEANGIPDRKVREGVRRWLRQSYAEDDDARDAAYASMVQQAAEMVSKGQPIPPGILSNLTEKDRTALLTPFARQDSIEALEVIARYPDTLTYEWLAANKGSFKRETYETMLGRISSGENKLMAVDAQEINVLLTNNGYGNLVSPKTDDEKTQSLMFRQYVEDQLKRARATGELKPDTRQKILDDAVMNMGTITKRGLIWDSESQMPMSMMTQKQRESVVERIQTQKVEAGGKVLWNPEKDYPAVLAVLAEGRERAIAEGDRAAAARYEPTPEIIKYFYEQTIEVRRAAAREQSKTKSRDGRDSQFMPAPSWMYY